MAKSKLRLAQIMEKIGEALLQTREYLEIFRYLDEHNQSAPFERAEMFFTATREAAWREVILGITRLTDDDPESINFKMLLNMAENHPRILRHSPAGPRELVTTNRIRLTSLDPLLKSLRPIRDRQLAHLDRKHLNDPAAVSPESIPIQDLFHCLEVFKLILSEIWQALFSLPLPEDQGGGQITKELEDLWKMLEESMQKAGQGE